MESFHVVYYRNAHSGKAGAWTSIRTVKSKPCANSLFAEVEIEAKDEISLSEVPLLAPRAAEMEAQVDLPVSAVTGTLRPCPCSSSLMPLLA